MQRLRALGQTDEAWNKWISFFLVAVEEQARINAQKARGIIDLYNELKRKVLELTHSQFAVPLLDLMFARPVFQSSEFKGKPTMPSSPMIANLLSKLKTAGILKVVREGSGRRPQVLALIELINLCEGRKVI